jgi:hypothetical protein
MVGRVSRMSGTYQRSIVRYCRLLDGNKNNAKVTMSAAAASRWTVGGIVVDSTLEDMEGSIEWVFK